MAKAVLLLSTFNPEVSPCFICSLGCSGRETFWFGGVELISVLLPGLGLKDDRQLASYHIECVASRFLRRSRVGSSVQALRRS